MSANTTKTMSPYNGALLKVSFIPILFAIPFALAYYFTASLALLVAFPFFWLVWRTRTQSFIFVFAYYLLLNWEEFFDSLKFFPNKGIYFSFFIFVAHALFMSVWWVLLYSPKKTSLNLILRTLLINVILTLPPLGFFVWLQPLTCAGALFPGLGFTGLFLSIILMCCLTSCIAKMTRIRIILVFLLAVAAIITNLSYRFPPIPAGWTAINTNLGNAPSNVFKTAMREFTLVNLAQNALDAGDKVILFPENIALDWLAGTQDQWGSVLQSAKNKGANIILGAQIDWSDGSYENTLIMFGSEGYEIHPARQPMPLGLWRPWSRETYHAHWFNSGKIKVDHQIAAYLICYEQMIPWPILSSFLNGPKPTIVISSANQWFSGASGYRKQHNAMLANVRLFGVPSLTAVNR